MTVADFHRIALSLEGAEESSHMGAADFRVGGRIFATLASAKQGYGNLMLTPELQEEFVQELPEVFLPVHGGWGKSGATHIRLAEASEDGVAEGVLARAQIGLGLDEPEKGAKQYFGMTADQVRAAFAKQVRPDDFVLISRGPVGK